ncbi:MAG TPA: phosphatidate cytidylyltransferase, partial [Actinomycetota bacterium]|nr:phosphatidate cytidylyltransferase [Actinomycetota bacterium]
SFPFVIAVALFLSFVVMLLRRDRANVTRAVSSTLMPVVCVGLPAAYVVVLRSARAGYTLAWVFVSMALAAEAGASAVTWFARRRALTPRARRTWEHLGGALAGAVIAAVVAGAAASPPFTWARALILAALVAPTVTAGDLAWATVEDDLARTEPGVQRQRVVVLSRVGGVVLSAPVFFYVFRALVS